MIFKHFLFLLSVKCYRDGGIRYQGKVNKTISGYDCMNWRDVITRNLSGLVNSDLSNDNNWCRNPGNLGKKPWCFTKSSKVPWEYCNISFCHPGTKILIF